MHHYLFLRTAGISFMLRKIGLKAILCWRRTSDNGRLAFVIVCAGVWIIRRRSPELARPFRTPLVPLVPILGIVISLAIMLSLTPVAFELAGSTK